MAVKEVKKRGDELAQKRKKQGQQYEGIKSKVAANMRVIDKVNRRQGFNQNPYAGKKKPQSASTMQKRKLMPPRKLNDSELSSNHSMRPQSAFGQDPPNFVNQQHDIIRAVGAADEDVLAKFKERAQKLISERPVEINLSNQILPGKVVARPNLPVRQTPQQEPQIQQIGTIQLKPQTTEDLEAEDDEFFGAELLARQETINIELKQSNGVMSRWKRQ